MSGSTHTKRSFPIINKIRGKKSITPIITSVPKYNDPYMPHISPHTHSAPCLSKAPAVRHHVNASMPRLTIKPQQVHHHHHHYYLNTPSCPNSPLTPPDQPFYTHSSYSASPPLSPPPLSPNLSRPSWRNSKRSSTWQPAPSVSSSEEDEDDNIPLGLQLIKSDSLLSDCTEDGDDELIPIAGLSLNTPYMSAAEKYKAKVKARLF